MSDTTPPKPPAPPAKANKPAPGPAPRCLDISNCFGTDRFVPADGLQIALVNACTSKNPMPALPILRIKNRPDGKPQDPATSRVYVLHWQVTDYHTAYNDYHVVIAFNPANKQPFLLKVREFDVKGAHIWGRNSGMIGVSFAAAYDAHPALASGKSAYYGPYPPTPEMCEMAAQFIAEHMAYRQHLPHDSFTLPKMTCNDTDIWVVPGETEVKIITDHKYLAGTDDYSGARWDTDAFTPGIINRVDVIYAELKGRPKPDGTKREFEFESIL